MQLYKIHLKVSNHFWDQLFKHFTDFGANFDRLDLHRAVQVKQKQSRRLKVESITRLLIV
jgi:hypothetical protein